MSNPLSSNGGSWQPPPLIPIHAATPPPPRPPVPVPDPNLEELELMMNWYNIDIHPFSTNLEYKAVWQKALQQESLTHLFLMHGILALSALELGRRKGCDATNVNQRSYTAIALGHYLRAVALSQPVLKNINEENCKAVFLLPTLLTAFAFGSPQQAWDLGNSRHPIARFHLVLLLARGMGQVQSTAIDKMKDGKFDTLIKPDSYSPWLPADAKAALCNLHQLNENCEQYSISEKNIYNTTINQVEIMLGQIHVAATRPNPAVMWATEVPPLYLELMRAYKPMALVVLAHYCVILHHLRGIWCGCTKVIIEGRSTCWEISALECRRRKWRVEAQFFAKATSCLDDYYRFKVVFNAAERNINFVIQKKVLAPFATVPHRYVFFGWDRHRAELKVAQSRRASIELNFIFQYTEGETW
ncbi:hypothetical protein RJ035_007182 [Blastomyces gilchristii]